MAEIDYFLKDYPELLLILNGSLIIFDSKHLHCTGKMLCDWKMGLSLRFKGLFGDEL